MPLVSAQEPLAPPLAPPPRRVPWTVRLRLLLAFSGTGWALLGFTATVTVAMLHRSSELSWREAVVAALFSSFGLVLLAFRWRTGRRRIRLLAVGEAALGTIVSKRWTGLMVNEDTMAVLVFSFTSAAGRRLEAEIRTFHPWRLERVSPQRLVYDPACPRHALALAALPRGISIDARGQLRAGVLGALVRLVPPALALAVPLGVGVALHLR